MYENKHYEVKQKLCFNILLTLMAAVMPNKGWPGNEIFTKFVYTISLITQKLYFTATLLTEYKINITTLCWNNN